jgi:hypothetical protein
MECSINLTQINIQHLLLSIEFTSQKKDYLKVLLNLTDVIALSMYLLLLSIDLFVVAVVAVVAQPLQHLHTPRTPIMTTPLKDLLTP